jgi:hypothetical protein
MAHFLRSWPIMNAIGIPGNDSFPLLTINARGEPFIAYYYCAQHITAIHGYRCYIARMNSM